MAIESRLAIVNGGRAIAAYITFDAKEAGGDHSSVRGNWTKVVWRSRDGSRVRRIVSKEHERIADYSKPGRGFEIDMRATGASRYDYGGPLNHLTKSYGYLVGAKVVGDTDGDDISDDRDPRGDTAIYLIEFGEVRVELER